MAMYLRFSRLQVMYCLSFAVLIIFGVLPYIFAGFIIVPPAYVYHYPHHPDLSLEADDYLGFIHDPFEHYGYSYENVTFSTSDGVTLSGWFVPGDKPEYVVITAHGATEDRRQFLRHLRPLHEIGLSVLLFDCREHGLSEGNGRGVSYSVREHIDVLAAVAFVKRVYHPKAIVALGTSQGASSVLLAAAQSSDISAVIAENPFIGPEHLLSVVVPTAIRTKPKWGAHETGVAHLITEYVGGNVPTWYINWIIRVTLWRLGASDQHDISKQIARIAPRPIMLLHGTNDTMVPMEHSKQLHELAGFPKELWLAENAIHARLFNMYPKEWERRVTEFLHNTVMNCSDNVAA
eukprot:TRINITY_DN1373_c0_g1_i3.p1 TRINITY_DN1373_c0_g1~~TRINITY_DN1373_c0_g1_i3.p1  ORF type:complete len:379 (-),score=30.63 TRINITY_DN1373_c0_g1_i3:86-1129(-)